MVQKAKETREGVKRAVSRAERSVTSEASATLAAVEAERDRLKASLEKAEARIAELESSRSAVVNRIDWLIDSLGSALEKRAG